MKTYGVGRNFRQVGFFSSPSGPESATCNQPHSHAMHVPEPLQHIMCEMPAYVQTAMATGAAAVLALADVAWQAMTGQVPSPEQAGQWSFYGVLIVAVIVLFSSLASVIYLVATKGLKAFQDLTDALGGVKESMKKVNDTLEKQNDYFDEIAKGAVRSALTTPPK